MTLPVVAPQLPMLTAMEIERIRRLEEESRRYLQIEIETQHVFHAGMYVRTIHIPAGVVLTGALMKIPTVVIVSGSATVHTGIETVMTRGYHVLQGEIGRKTVFLTHEDTYVSMIFPTNVTTVGEAENEFTCEAHLLLSRQQNQGE